MHPRGCRRRVCRASRGMSFRAWGASFGLRVYSVRQRGEGGVPVLAGAADHRSLVPDPAAVNGTPEEIERAFNDAFVVLDRRIGLFLALPMATLEQLAIHQEIDRIGRASGQLCFAVWLRSLGDAAAARCGGGFGIMGERLAAVKLQFALLPNTLATGAALMAIVLCVWADLRAHLNPAVTPNGSQ
jgi:hypothetical protein